MSTGNLKFLFLLIGLILFSCNKEERKEIQTLPIGVFPDALGQSNIPVDNAYSDLRWQLGKMMFYDVSFSRDSSISCASCHKQEFAFGDNASTTNGAFDRTGKRNVPSITNVSYFPYFLREGGLNTLEKQVLVPIQEHNEFDLPMPELLDRLSKNHKYTQLSLEAYGREIDPFVITRAISNFERSIVSYRSKYDLWLAGESSALSEVEKRGYQLFTSEKLACAKCHSEPLFTNFGFENNGLYIEYNDAGRYRLTGLENDIAKFKVPSLRNLSYSAPYMHNGAITTIEEVIDHYNRGGEAHKNKSHLIKPLNLTTAEKADLKAFLLSLDDHELIKDERYK